MSPLCSSVPRFLEPLGIFLWFIWIPGLFFLSLIKTSLEEFPLWLTRHLCLFPILKTFNLSPLSMMLAVNVIYAFYDAEVNSFCTQFVEILTWKSIEFCQMLFFASTEIMQFLSFILLMCCITFIDLHVFNHPCIPGLNPIWSWCMILPCGLAVILYMFGGIHQSNHLVLGVSLLGDFWWFIQSP